MDLKDRMWARAPVARRYVSQMKRLAVLIVSIVLALIPISTVSAQTPNAPRNVGITGMWLGTNYGYENGVFKSTDVRYSITEDNKGGAGRIP